LIYKNNILIDDDGHPFTGHMKYSDGREYNYLHGKLHKLYGAAVKRNAPIDSEWWIIGIQYTYAEYTVKIREIEKGGWLLYLWECYKTKSARGL